MTMDGGTAKALAAAGSSHPAQYQVIPNTALGQFILGMPLGLVIKRLSDQYGHFREVSLYYNQANPLALDIVVDVVSEGIQLRFDPRSQRLKFIDVYDPRKIGLLYSGQPICSGGNAPTYAELYHKFGIMRGQYLPLKKMYLLKYPGLSLWFAVSPDKEVRGDVELTSHFTFQDGTAPVLSNLCIYRGQDSDSPDLPPMQEVFAACGCSPSYFEEVLVTKDLGLEFTVQKKKVKLGDCCQDILTELGAPDDVFYKSEDKMRIHAVKRSEPPCADFFYNYFALGIDVLFDAQTNTAKKFILHTNVPGHFDFYRYAKCNFRIQIMGHGLHATAPLSPSFDRPTVRAFSSSGGGMAASVVDMQPGPLSFDEQLITVDLTDRPAQPQYVITPDSKWSEIQAFIPPSSEPVPFNRPPSANTVDPFGITSLHCVNGCMIFEVLPNSFVSTVTIFPGSHGQQGEVLSHGSL